MIKNHLLKAIALTQITLFTLACNNGSDTQRTNSDSLTIIAYDLEQTHKDSISKTIADTEDSSLLVKAPGAKSGLEKSFDAMYQNCFKAGDNPPTRKLVFLATSSSKTIGTVYNRNGKDLVNSLYKCFLKDGKIDSTSALKELSTFVEFNNTSTCDLTQTKNLSLSYLLKYAIDNIGNAKLSGDYKRSDSVILNATTWQKIEIYDSLYARYLSSSTNPSIMQYRKDAINEDNIVLVKVYKISGFSGEIYKNTGFNTDLTADLLKKGITAPIDKNTTDTSGNNKAEFHLKIDNEKSTTIKVTSSGDFYVYAFFKKFKSKR